LFLGIKLRFKTRTGVANAIGFSGVIETSNVTWRIDVELLEMAFPSLVSYAIIKHSNKAISGVISAKFTKRIAPSGKNTEHQVTLIVDYHTHLLF